MNTTLTCTCDRPDAIVDHDYECELWDDPGFLSGVAWWDATAQQLVVDVDDDDGVYGETFDLLEEALARNLDDSENMDTMRAAMLAMIGEPTYLVLDDIANGITTFTDLDMVLVETWALQMHLTPEQGSLPLYDCYCYSGLRDTDCGECGVRSVTIDGGHGFVPTAERLLHEMEMFLLGDIYRCTHTHTKLTCKDCGVQRAVLGSNFWTFYDPKAASSGVTVLSSTPFGSSGYGTGYGSATFQKCRHYSQPVVFPDGTQIWASSSHTRKPDEPQPDFGIYMYDGWPNTVLAYKLHWRDYGLPVLPDSHVLQAAVDGLTRARDGEIVEIGCMGGHGRTGSFMAVMLLLAGFTGTPEEAVKWVHTNYCKEAIEGDIQEWYIAKIHAQLNGLPVPRQPCTYTQHKDLYAKDQTCDCKEWAADFKKLSEPPVNHTAKYDTFVSDWTPVPPKPTKLNDQCTLRRHYVLYWKWEFCDCYLWASDVVTFNKDKTSRRPGGKKI